MWNANSRAVFFHAFEDASSAILRLPLGGVVQPVANLSQFGFALRRQLHVHWCDPDGAHDQATRRHG